MRAAPTAVGPAATLVAGAIGCAALVVTDPTRAGAPVLCPFRALTGLDCPGCGTTRAIYSLLHGDATRAIGFNVLAVAFLPFLAWAWLAWASPRLGGPRLPAARLPRRLVTVLPAVVALFWIARNVPWTPFRALHS